MRRHRSRVLTSLAAGAAFVAATVLSAAPALATGPTFTVTPSTDLDNGTFLHWSLTGASALNGQSLTVDECNETVNATQDQKYYLACQSLGGMTITNGSASAGAMAVEGNVKPGAPGVDPECTPETNGQCDIVALTGAGNSYTLIGSVPISFEPPQTPAVTATPHDNVVDGQAVDVEGTGIPASQSSMIEVQQCNTATDSCESLGYGAAANHVFSKTVNAYYGGACDETTDCAIQLEYLDSFTSSNDAVLASTPISFAAPDPQISITPSSGLKDGQTLTVSASGIPQKWQFFQIEECNTTYVAGHGGFGQPGDQPGCATLGPTGSFSGGAMTTTVDVTEGSVGYGSPAGVCEYTNNGSCEIVLLDSQNNPVTFTAAQPITFRPPVTGPATLQVGPASGLYFDAPVTVYAPGDVKDGLDSVAVEECNIAAVQVSGFGNKSCLRLGYVPVKDNTALGKVPVFEGDQFTDIQYRHWFTCDDRHACELGLFGSGLESTVVPIDFRNPNRGTPVTTASDLTGLTRGERITVTASHLSDLLREVQFMLCNVKAMPGKYSVGGNCHLITPPGSVVPTSKNQAVQKNVKVFAGVVGETNSGRKVLCNAKTNGACAIVTLSYESGRGSHFVGMSKRLRYKK